MKQNVCGLIIADDIRIQLGELSRPRALSAVPFAGRYRLIDFPLSNMVNSGITTVGISTYYKYKSLMDHLGTGAAWDLDRKRSGLFMLPPYVNAETFIGTSGDDLSGVLSFYQSQRHDYVIVASSDYIINSTYDDLMEFHLAKQADISVYYKDDGEEPSSRKLILDLADDGKVRTVYDDPLNPPTRHQVVGAMLMETKLFVSILADTMARGQRDVDFYYFIKLCEHLNVYAKPYAKTVLRFTSIQDYFKATLRLLRDEACRNELLGSSLPIYTKVKDEAPTYYSDGCIVEESMISDGCVIQGSVENCMLFRGVMVGPQAKLKNSIIFQDTQISEACELDHCIIDKDCVLRPGIQLVGQEAYPVVIGKGAVV